MSAAEVSAKAVKGPGERLLRDIFRRADKNDDGLISADEFRAYFRDSHLRAADYDRIFRAVDADHSGQIDVKELFAFFSKEFAPFAGSFAATESLHEKLAETLRDTHALWTAAQADDETAFQRRFQTRVLMRELLTQLDAAQAVVEGSLEHLDQSHPADADAHGAAAEDQESIIEPFHLLSSELPPVNGQVTTQSSMSLLSSLVDRLSHIVGKLDASGVRIKLPEVDVIAESEADNAAEAFVIVQRTMRPLGDQTTRFLKAVKKYAQETKAEIANHQVYAHELGKNNGVWVLYEVWGSAEAYKDHFRTTHSRGFTSMLCDLLEGPEEVQSMNMPASFFFSRA